MMTIITKGDGGSVNGAQGGRGPPLLVSTLSPLVGRARPTKQRA